jgi:hypothetical protein
MKKIFFFFILIAVFISCSKVYEPDIESLAPFLVIEGSISTKPGTNYIFLSNSRPYNENSYFSGQRGAEVIVTDDEGSVFEYTERGNGAYSLEMTEGHTAEIGRTYTLRVTTSDGSVYESTPQKIVQSAPIKNLLCAADQQSILTENVYGEALEETFDGINVIVESDGILPSANYYLYSWKAYEEQHTLLNQGISYFDIYRHNSLNNKYSNIIHTANADQYYNFQLRNEVVFFIIKGDMTNYVPLYPDSFILVDNFFEGLLINLQQKSISADVYTFYHDVENQLSAEGRLFDPISPQLVGNIKCTSDESVKVIGVFYASDITEKTSYFYVNPRNRTYSRHIDSLPELWLDTCSWGYPNGWISPPF